MIRVAIIQNGIEMQHSGYVDALSMYKDFEKIERDAPEFTRFSGINIRDLFINGERYLLDYDALILGTNATSDDDVYNVLREETNKKLLAEFIDSGRGLLICSQKKYQNKQDDTQTTEYKVNIDDKNSNFAQDFQKTGKGEFFYSVDKVVSVNKSNKRISGFMPTHYEYCVEERPSNEKSSMGNAVLISEENCTLNQKCIICMPNKNRISNSLIENHCINNSFQKHYYRDIINPVYDSAYQPVIVDNKNGAVRNLLMVAVPQKQERIIISTMALDWAGHKELLENILNYLVRGIPNIAFIHKDNFDNKEMEVLRLDAELSKLGYCQYKSIDMYLEKCEWHSLVVFSPEYYENEVLAAWKKIKEINKFAKVYHYRTIEKKTEGDTEDKELVLVKYSNNTYIEQQKMDVLAWLNSKKGTKKLWDNSLWKTYDVIKLYYSMANDIGKERCFYIFNDVIEAIIKGDDKGKCHYREDGSYDGVLAPTCGVMEMLYWAKESLLSSSDDRLLEDVTQRMKSAVEQYNKDYDKTRSYLLDKYNADDNSHNKMFILRTFYHCNDYYLADMCKVDDDLLRDVFAEDAIDLDLCLYAEIAVILYNNDSANNDYKRKLKKFLYELVNHQLSNGKWENSMSTTASILLFLLQMVDDLKRILTDADGMDLINQIKSCIDNGITAIKSSYSQECFNWENNIVTSANALLVLYLYDKNSEYMSKDFLRSFINESYVSATYNALNLSLNTLDKTTDELNQCKNKMYAQEQKIEYYKMRNAKQDRRLYIVSAFAGFGIFGLISMAILLIIDWPEAFKDVIDEVFMWVPIAIGLVITPVVTYIIKKISTIATNDKDRKSSKKKEGE